jgi:hypothetical protein
VYNLAKKMWVRLTRVERDVCWIWFGFKEVEYISEDKVFLQFDALL